MQLSRTSSYTPLDLEGRYALADALGDTPETAISVHLLRRGCCRAYAAGDPHHFDEAVVQSDFCPAEPMGFGSDPAVLWELLKHVEGWDCVNMASDRATALGEIIETETGGRVRYYGDVYHILSRPAASFQNLAVRQLTLDDCQLLESAAEEVQGSGFGNPRGLLSHGIAACATVSDRIVAIAHTHAQADRHADIGAFTAAEWRGSGFATAAASIVAQRVQENGRMPVWSAGEDNIASLRVAQKLGFTEVSRRTYVIKI